LQPVGQHDAPCTVGWLAATTATSGREHRAEASTPRQRGRASERGGRDQWRGRAPVGQPRRGVTSCVLRRRVLVAVLRVAEADCGWVNPVAHGSSRPTATPRRFNRSRVLSGRPSSVTEQRVLGCANAYRGGVGSACCIRHAQRCHVEPRFVVDMIGVARQR